jgi:2-polyprenyl-3-methyl-5-hydroxy-6-metoxy-1,4-benzoquinol methylase
MNPNSQTSATQTETISKIKCRLCGADASFKFELPVLKSRQVKYYMCTVCESLQTQTPDWLELAYGDNLAAADSGAAQRTLRNLVVSYFVSRLSGAKNILDIGGGDGLLCRFLRDYSLNAFVQDKYSRPIYAQHFTKPNFNQPDMVLAFEVLEHFANPALELESLFKQDASFYLMSTGIYSGEDADWWYLVPITGQHIFFYSRKALDYVSKKFSLNHIIQGNLILFYKPTKLMPLRVGLLRFIMRREISWLLRSVVVLLPNKGTAKDHLIENQE